MRSWANILALVPLAVSGFCQTPEPAGRFEIADVHLSPPRTQEGGLYMHEGRFEMHGVTMLRLITTAWGMDPDRVFGGPNWLDFDRFEVIAKTSQPLNRATLQPMLQALLADRFGLAVRLEDRPQPIFALVKTDHVRLKESAESGPPQCKNVAPDGYIGRACQSMTMAQLAERLPFIAPNYFPHPVVDKTGLTGAYDFTLKWTGRAQIGFGVGDRPSISLYGYFEKELGIKVEQQSQPVRSLVIEHVNEKPFPNPPDISEKLPPPIAEFEVAAIHPTQPGTPQTGRLTNGRLTLTAFTLRGLITFAYGLPDDMVKGGDKWLDADRFEIVAKADPDATLGALQVMMRTLLVQRFHMAVHEEQQPVQVYALSAPKGEGKLKDTSGEEHAGCVRNPRDGALVVTCHNTTMAQFADQLPRTYGAENYLDHPVVDQNGLTGSYDFEISYQPPQVASGRPAFGGGAGGRGRCLPRPRPPAA